MTTALDTDLVPAVQELLDEFGKDITFTIPGQETYNGSNQEVIAMPPSTPTVKMSPPKYTRRTEGDVDVVVGRAYLAAQNLTFTPVKDMKFLIDGSECRILIADALYSGESIAAWRLTWERSNH